MLASPLKCYEAMQIFRKVAFVFGTALDNLHAQRMTAEVGIRVCLVFWMFALSQKSEPFLFQEVA